MDIFQQYCQDQLGIAPTKEYRFYSKRRWRFDYAFIDKKIAIEQEGGIWTRGRHTRPQGYINDMEKYNTAQLLGWKVLRFSTQQMISSESLRFLKALIQ